MSIDAMKLALHTLEGWANHGDWVWPESALEQAKRNTTESITALRAAIEQAQPDELMIWKSRAMSAERIIEKFMQPEQEPVFELGFGWLDDATKYPRGTKLYASPSRKWQSLTAREIENLWRYTYPYHDHQDFARAIEAKLKEKNNG